MNTLIKLSSHQNCDKKIKIKYNNAEDLFLSKLKKFKNKKFLFFPEEKKTFTYEEFYKEYDKISQIFISKKLNKGEKISIIFYNESKFLTIYFAALALGIVVVPINPDLSFNEINYIVKNSNSKICIYSDKLKNKIKKTKIYLSEKKFFNYKNKMKINFINKYKKNNLIKLNDLAIIIYTSGTTGKPKGVVINHLNILSDAYAISKNFKFDTKTRALCILPLFHNNGQIATFFSPLYKGGSSVITFGKTNIYNFWNYIEKYKITWTSVMASILSLLLSLKKNKKNNSLKGILCGGQILTKEILNKFEKRFNVPIYEGYGLTETTSFSCINKFPKKNRVLGSIGKSLIINDMKIFDPKSFKEKKFNEEGEICIRGFNVACNYYNLNNVNKKSFYKGWFRSGDFGSQDERGNFFFSCRKDSLIIKGGENIYPAEIENALYKINDIEECAAIGIPDKFLGENICAFVKLKQHSKQSDLTIKKKLSKLLGDFKMPKLIIVLNNLKNLKEIPKGPTKKILYRKLKLYYEKNY